MRKEILSSMVIIAVLFTVIVVSLLFFSKNINLFAYLLIISALVCAFIKSCRIFRFYKEYNFIDYLNANKAIIEHNAILQAVIKSSNLLIRIVKSDGHVVFSDKIFDDIALEKYLTPSEFVFYKDKYYKVIQKKVPDFSKKGDILIIILEDVSEYKKSNERKETFFAMLAHDIKTPVLAISRTIKLLQDGVWGELSKEQKEILALCHESSNFIAHLVQNILHLYKIGQKQNFIEIKPFDICKTILNTQNELRVFLPENALSIKSNIPESFIINGDEAQIKRVIINLIYNAIKYSKPMTEIEVVAYFDEHSFIFEVKNEGSYISKNDIKSIFNKDFSLDNPYSKHGTGLGLYLSKEIIHAHCGEMIVKSSKQNINTFGFSLKLSDVSLSKS